MLTALKEEVARARYPRFFRDMARLEAEAVELWAHDAIGVNSLLRTEECTRAILTMRRRSGLGTAADLRALMRRETGLDPLEPRRRFDRRQAELQASSSAEPHGKPRPLTGLETSGSRPGRGVDSPHPAVRAPSGPLRDEQLPVDRHLMPRDAAERRLVRQGVLQRRATCLPACREARRGKPERELEGSEVVAKTRHGRHSRTWLDDRTAKGSGPGGCGEPAMHCLSTADPFAPWPGRRRIPRRPSWHSRTGKCRTG